MEITGRITPEIAGIFTSEALNIIAKLEREFGDRRRELLQKRNERQLELNAGQKPAFPAATASIREKEWSVAESPPDLQRRWIEITGPTDRKMVINALNSGADTYMADFEDSNAPTWENMVQGQINLRDAVQGTITFRSPEGKSYRLNEKASVLMVRPRGWHLHEKHVRMDGVPVSGALFDFGLFFCHNARRLIEKGTGPYFYLPKTESRFEARLWNDVFSMAQDELNIPRGTIRATVLIENILAAFEMEEILYELRDHAAGLNAGRWDYIFSIIRKFRNDQEIVFPDRSQVTMKVPFMRAYTDLLVKTCHRRRAHAIGGMAAFIPSRKDSRINEVALANVREDKEREAGDGFDGTWVAHPDLVATAREPFAKVLGVEPHQKDRRSEDARVTAKELLDFRVPGGQISEDGLRNNINIALQYLESWLGGNGCVPIYNLMEDTATAEIARAQVWQWLHRPTAVLADGRRVTNGLLKELMDGESEKIKGMAGAERFAAGKYELSAEIFERLATAETFVDFLTLEAYEHL